MILMKLFGLNCAVHPPGTKVMVHIPVHNLISWKIPLNMFAAAPIVATVDNFNILANYIKVGGKLAVNFSNYPSIKHELSETVKLLP